jgi:hypothetical protein
MKRLLPVARAVLLLAATPGITNAQANTFTDYAGDWDGRWIESMSSGRLTLQVNETGSGHLSLTMRPNFGSTAVDLTDVRVDGGSLKFRAIGQDGHALDAALRADASGTLRGEARLHGFRMLLVFRRAGTK